jgi:hypothetical protein
MRCFLNLLIWFWVCSHAALAHSVRTLAFILPDGFPPEIELSSPALKDATKMKVSAPNFGEPAELPPGHYTAKISQLPKTAQFSLPDSKVEKFILVVIASRLDDWTIVAIPDDVRTFAKGDFHLINASPSDIGVRFSKTKVLIKAGRTTVMKMPEADFQHGQFEVEMSTLIDNKLSVFNSTVWRRTPKVRTLVLLYVDPKTSRYRTLTFGDYDFAEGEES